MAARRRHPEVENGNVRRPSIMRLVDYSQFRKDMKALYPNITYAQISEIWNFANDCWSDGYKTGKRGG